MKRFELALLGVVFLLAPTSTSATVFKHPVLIQITNNTVGDVQTPRLRSEKPEALVFSSNGDVLGAGTATPNQELYLWSLADWTSGGSGLQRITMTTGGNSFDAARPTDTTQTSRPEYVAFVSTGDLDPSVGNPDGNEEIFIWIRTTGEVRQITDTAAPVVNLDPYASDSGRCIVFSSNADMDDNDGSLNPQNNPGTGFDNGDGSREVFLVHLDVDAEPEPGSFTQVSNGPAGTTSGEPVIGGYYYPRQCNVLAYRSDHIQVPGGEPGDHIYIFKRQAGENELMSAAEFLTTPGNIPAAGDYFSPGMSSASNFARGPHVVFHTTADLWNNAPTAENIFRYRKFHSRVTQYTDMASGVARDPQVSDGGRWIAFEANGELLFKARKTSRTPPFNPDGNFEIFRLQGNRRVRQVTDTSGCENGQISLQDNGVSLAFRSTCELIPGGNPLNVPQIYMYLQFKRKHPLLAPAACTVANGCCNLANGCFESLEGKKFKVRKKNSAG